MKELLTENCAQKTEATKVLPNVIAFLGKSSKSKSLTHLLSY